MIFLSIIVPTYNRSHIIKRTLDSLIDQEFDNYEIIVVDDGSTDNTEEVVNSLNSTKIQYYKIENGERSKARNFGMKMAKGKYINWFDSDDIALPNHLSTIYSAAINNSFPDVIRLDYAIYNSNTKKKKNILSSKNLVKALIRGNSFGTGSIIVKRSIAQLNPFNENVDLIVSEDYELWLRLLSKYKFHCEKVITNYLVQHKERSVFVNCGSLKFEKRLHALFNSIFSNPETNSMIGSSKNFFKMRNYLVLSADLNFHKYKKEGFTYLVKGLKSHPSAIYQKIFWASIKHLIKQ